MVVCGLGGGLIWGGWARFWDKTSKGYYVSETLVDKNCACEYPSALLGFGEIGC